MKKSNKKTTFAMAGKQLLALVAATLTIGGVVNPALAANGRTTVVKKSSAIVQSSTIKINNSLTDMVAQASQGRVVTEAVNWACNSEEAKNFAQEALYLTNQIRAGVGSQSLVLSSDLNRAAAVRVVEMARADTLSHTRPNGSSYNTIVDVLCGENILYRRLGSNESEEDLIKILMNQWRNSEGHYKNMCNTRYTRMGVAFYKSENGKWFGCQIFTRDDEVKVIDIVR